MKITFLGHASLGIQVGDINILVDPFISANPKASHINIEELKADYILLTHAHQDHILDVEAIAKRTNAPSKPPAVESVSITEPDNNVAVPISAVVSRPTTKR